MGQTIGNLGNKDVMDPNQAEWGDLSTGEKGARLFGGAAKGALQSLGNQQRPQMQGGSQMQIPQTAQPQVDLASTIRQSDQDPFNRKPTRDPFYGV